MVSKGQVTAFLGLLNAMIGGTILVLPLLGLAAGYLWIPILCIFYGFISYYSCQLILQHLGDCPNIRTAILEHFNNRHYVTVIYNLVMSIALFAVIINYYLLVIKQMEGFFTVTPISAAILAITLFFLTTLLRSVEFGQKLLAIGILSVVMYLGFLIWAHASNPGGQKQVPAFTNNFVNLGAALTMAFSVHDVVMQILLKTTTKQKFTNVIRAIYLAGTLIYIFICYGSYAIVNRNPNVQEPEVIQEYFPKTSWPVRWIEILYTFHMMTAIPQFTIIMKVRFLQMFKIQESHSVTKSQISTYFITFLFCFLCWVSRIKIAMIIQLNGSIIGFLYIFFIPIAVHIKCIYFTKHDENGVIVVQEFDEQGNVTIKEGLCQCSLDKNRNKLKEYGQLVFQIFIIIFGIVSVGYTLYTMFWKPETADQMRHNVSLDIQEF